MQNNEWSELEQRIRAVKPGAAAVWGKMAVAEMLVHCRLPLECGLGEYSTARNDKNSLKNTVMRWMVFNTPWIKGHTPTAPDFKVMEKKMPVRSTEEERGALADTLGRFIKGGFVPKPHPVLGPMDLAQWGTLMKKHLDYHLKQFGA
jgi:hypothetical protein